MDVFRSLCKIVEKQKCDGMSMGSGATARSKRNAVPPWTVAPSAASAGQPASEAASSCTNESAHRGIRAAPVLRIRPSPLTVWSKPKNLRPSYTLGPAGPNANSRAPSASSQATQSMTVIGRFGPGCTGHWLDRHSNPWRTIDKRLLPRNEALPLAPVYGDSDWLRLFCSAGDRIPRIMALS